MAFPKKSNLVAHWKMNDNAANDIVHKYYPIYKDRDILALGRYLGDTDSPSYSLYRLCICIDKWNRRWSQPYCDDSLVPERGLGADSQSTERVISQFLTELDGLEELKGVLVLAATNRKDLIDSAILRPGRFDFIIEIPLPDEEARRAIFMIHTRGRPLAGDVDIQLLTQETEGLAGSDIEAIYREASLSAIREAIQSGQQKVKITQKHFRVAMNWLKKQKGE